MRAKLADGNEFGQEHTGAQPKPDAGGVGLECGISAISSAPGEKDKRISGIAHKFVKEAEASQIGLT